MKRFIRLNERDEIISIRWGDAIVEGEIASDAGGIGQIMNADGTFSDPLPPPTEETQLDRIETTLDLLLLKQEGII